MCFTYVVVALLLDELPGLSTMHAHELFMHCHAELVVHDRQLVDYRLLEVPPAHCARGEAVVAVPVSFSVGGEQDELGHNCLEELRLGPQLWVLLQERNVLEPRATFALPTAVFVDEPRRKVIALGDHDDHR